MSDFFRRGITKVFVVPTITITAPTAVQVNAGTSITASIADISGFTFENSPIGTPRLSSTFTTSIPGEDTAQDAQLTFYEDTATNTLYTTLAKGTVTNLVFFYRGTAGATPAAVDRAEIWPVLCTGPAREYSMGNDPARWMTKFACSSPPAFDIALV